MLESLEREIVHRPWGWFSTVYADSLHWVKILTIKPGCNLSLQKHRFRSEVWSTTDYGVRAVIGERAIDLQPHVSYSVPVGVEHRLMNPTAHVVSVVEFAQGHPREDDIIRLDDDWGRT